MSYPLRPFHVFFTNYYATANFKCKPFPALYKSRRCPYPGFSAELFGLLAKDLNLEIVPFVITNGDENRDSNFEALGKELGSQYKEVLANRVIDAHSSLFQAYQDRQHRFDFTETIYSVRSNLFVYREDFLGQSWWSLFKVYDVWTWRIIFVIFALQCLFVSIVHKVEFKFGQNNNEGIGSVIWKIIRLQCFQPEKINLKFISGNFSVLLFALLQCGVIFGVFASYFLSSLMINQKDISVKKTEYLLDELRNGRRKIIASAIEPWLESMMYTSDKEPYVSLRKATKNVSFGDTGTVEKALYQLRHEKALLATVNDDLISYKASLHCDIVPSNFKFDEQYARIMLWKDHPLTGLLNQSIIRNKMKIENLYKTYWGSNKQSHECNDFVIGDPLKLHSYMGLLLLMLAINSVAFGILIIEKIIFNQTIIKNKNIL